MSEDNQAEHRWRAAPDAGQEPAMLLTLQAREWFEALRTNRSSGWRGFSGLVPAKELGDSTLWQLTMEGEGLFGGQRVRRPKLVAASTDADQLPVSRSLLRFRGRRPVWDAPLLEAIRNPAGHLARRVPTLGSRRRARMRRVRHAPTPRTRHALRDGRVVFHLPLAGGGSFTLVALLGWWHPSRDHGRLERAYH